MENSSSALADFHDSEVVGITLDRENGVVRLEFSLEDGRRQTIAFSGVTGFRVDNLLQQNVVSRLLVSGIHEFTLGQLTHWVTWMNSTSTAPPFVRPDAIDDYVKLVLSGEMVLFVLEPSWGAECAILCNSFSS